MRAELTPGAQELSGVHGTSTPRVRARASPGTAARARKDGRELEQRPAALRLRVAEVAGVVDPRHVEQALLDAVVEPGAAEDELAQPVDERLAVLERDALPVADEVEAEPAPRIVDPAVGDELDQVGGLLLVDVVRRDRARAARRRRSRAPRSRRGELEPVAEELDDEVVSRAVVGREHRDSAVSRLLRHETTAVCGPSMAVVVLVDLARRRGGDEVLARADGVRHADRRRRRRGHRRARPALGEGRQQTRCAGAARR